LHAVSVGKPSVRMTNFWTYVRRFGFCSDILYPNQHTPRVQRGGCDATGPGSPLPLRQHGCWFTSHLFVVGYSHYRLTGHHSPALGQWHWDTSNSSIHSFTSHSFNGQADKTQLQIDRARLAYGWYAYITCPYILATIMPCVYNVIK